MSCFKPAEVEVVVVSRSFVGVVKLEEALTVCPLDGTVPRALSISARPALSLRMVNMQDWNSMYGP